MLEEITNWLLQLLDSIGLLGVFFATAIESFFAPIPSEIILVTAGLYAKAEGGGVTLVILSVVAALGSFVGTLPFYLISRFGVNTFLPKFLDRWGKYLLISNADLEKANLLFKKRGPLMVFVSRLIPGVRSLIAFPAGAAKMNFLNYTFFTLLGSFCWNIFLSGIGFLAYDYKDQIFQLLKPVENLVLIILVVLFLVYLYKVVEEVRKG